MNLRDRISRLLAKGYAPAEVAKRLKTHPSTVRWHKHDMASRLVGAFENAQKNTPEPEPKWCASLHHESAHLVKADGMALCSATIPLGGRWIPNDDVRKCTRCQGQMNKQTKGEA
jgi:hypothetical protein